MVLEKGVLLGAVMLFDRPIALCCAVRVALSDHVFVCGVLVGLLFGWDRAVCLFVAGLGPIVGGVAGFVAVCVDLLVEVR
ncbi:hypothetical protein AAHH78_32980, partial [Burkholderia pseudomallei]